MTWWQHVAAQYLGCLAALVTLLVFDDLRRGVRHYRDRKRWAAEAASRSIKRGKR